jgi:hypothetical protein
MTAYQRDTYDRYAKIQEHLTGGRNVSVSILGTMTVYTPSKASWFTVDDTGLYVLCNKVRHNITDRVIGYART